MKPQVRETAENRASAAASMDSPNPRAGGRPLRIAIVYDCFYPCTIGGSERWYRALAEHLARRHQVTFLTRNQWTRGQPPAVAGFELIGFEAGRQLYTARGRRRIGPPIRFGVKLFLHLLRHRRRYDLIHTSGFPYFPLLFAAVARWLGGPPLVVDWVEVWEPDYWRRYLGRIAGRWGAIVQDLCVAATKNALVFSPQAAAGLRRRGYRATPEMIAGQHVAPPPGPEVSVRSELVVFAGRHIAEKHVAAIPAAIALARARIPGLRGMIFGDGPERPKVLAEIGRLNLSAIVTCPGFAPWEEVDHALRQALCLILPSQREGYGMVVIEAAARGTPAIVVTAPASAATNLIIDRVNGVIAPSSAPADLAAAIVAVHASDGALARGARRWFAERATALSLESAAMVIQRAYRAAIAPRAAVTRSPNAMAPPAPGRKPHGRCPESGARCDPR